MQTCNIGGAVVAFGGAVVRALAFHPRGCGLDSQRELSQCYSNPVLHSVEKSQHSAESRGFSPDTPVSSHREVDRVG